MADSDKFSEKFKVSELLVGSTQYWNISVRPQQITPGTLVLSLKRTCSSMHELESVETADLSAAFTLIEKCLESFCSDKINYLALMMVDNQVHFHVVPRYSKAVFIEGSEYLDLAWPGPPDLSSAITLQASVVRDRIRSVG